jgi:hypothetical protein
MTFTQIGLSADAVTVPADVWMTSTSPVFKYHIAAPADWSVSFAAKASETDEFDSATYLFVAGYREPARGFTLSSLARDIRTNGPLGDFNGVKFVSGAYVVLDGVPAVKVVVRGTEGAGRVYAITYATINGGWFYQFAVIDELGHENTDNVFAAKVASTFGFP